MGGVFGPIKKHDPSCIALQASNWLVAKNCNIFGLAIFCKKTIAVLLSSPPSPSAGLGFEGASLAADFHHKSSHLLFVLFKIGHSLPKRVKIREVAESVPLQVTAEHGTTLVQYV